MNTRDISEFYNCDVPAYGSYDNIRKICGIDGLKNSQRKIIWAAFKRCYNDWIKTDTMCAQTQIDTAYIHGASNLEMVINGLVADYIGTNNYPLLVGNSGGFGCRLSTRAAAGRYTRMKLAPISKVLFSVVDNKILDKQFFEGQWIEPKFLMPVFPILFLNGSNGLSIGFSQDIYPRNPEEIILYIKKKLSGTEHPRMELLPWFKGHKGKVEINKEFGNYESFGTISKLNSTSYEITELPIGMDYQKYCGILDKLCENGIIQDYNDKCDAKLNDRILFKVKTTRDFSKKYEGRKLFEVLRLVKSLPETLNCIDENGRVREFKTVQEILDAFIEIRLKYYGLRKQHLLDSLTNELKKLVSKYHFCDGIIKKTIKVAMVKKDDIIAQLKKVPKIIECDGSYNYLLNMPIHSISKDTLDELKKQIFDAQAEFKKIQGTSVETMWTDDLHELKKVL